MKLPTERPDKTRPINQRIRDWYIWLDKEFEYGLLDWGLLIRGERTVLTAEMILVGLVQLGVFMVMILAFAFFEFLKAGGR